MSWKQIIPGVLEGIPGPEGNREQLDSLLRLSNIPPSTLQTHRLSTWVHGDSEPWWPKVQNYAEFKYDHPFLTFLGLPGTGKTHLALSLGLEWLQSGRSVLYHHVTGFLNALRVSYSHSGASDYEHFLSFTQNCSLLILDDFGVHRETDWANEQLDFIVDSRYEFSKPLIITSNFTLNDLPPRIADRLREGTLIQLKGFSFRGRRNATNK